MAGIALWVIGAAVVLLGAVELVVVVTELLLSDRGKASSYLVVPIIDGPGSEGRLRQIWMGRRWSGSAAGERVAVVDACADPEGHEICRRFCSDHDWGLFSLAELRDELERICKTGENVL